MSGRNGWLLVAAIVALLFLWSGGLYSTHSSAGVLWRVNRITGAASFCNIHGCAPMPEAEPPPAK